jgi:predicted Zn-dependent peptidase
VKRVRSCACVVSIVAALGAGSVAAASEAVHWQLDPATTVALVEDHRAALVHVVVELPVGAWSPWGRGVHAADAFEMQIYDSKGALRAEADRLGATVALETGTRSSRLTASCLSENADDVVALLREILENTDYDRRELTRRKHGRQLEWRASRKEPFFIVARASARVLFPAEDPRRQRWEEPEAVATRASRLVAARDAIVRLPGRILGFSGDLTRDAAGALAARLLPPASEVVPPRLAPVFSAPTPLEKRSRDVSLSLPRLTQAYFGYGRDSIPFLDPAYPAFLLADHVLGGHFYSRLYVALRHEGGETYGASTANLGDVVAGAYGMGTFTRAPNAAATEAKLREVLRVFAERGITEEERADAAGFLLGRRAFDRQSPEDVLDRFLLERRLGLPEGFYARVAERAASLPLAEINAFIARYYAPDGFTMVEVAP